MGLFKNLLNLGLSGLYKLGEVEAAGLERLGVIPYQKRSKPRRVSIEDENNNVFRPKKPRGVMPEDMALDGRRKTRSVDMTTDNSISRNPMQKEFQLHQMGSGSSSVATKKEKHRNDRGINLNTAKKYVRENTIKDEKAIVAEFTESQQAKERQRIATEYAEMGETKAAKGYAYAEYHDAGLRFDSVEDFYEQLEADLAVVAEDIDPDDANDDSVPDNEFLTPSGNNFIKNGSGF